MAKIRTALSMLGSAKDAKKFAARFDDPNRTMSTDSLFPPEDVRPAATDARTLLFRVASASESDIIAVVHTTAARDSVAVLVFNPNIVVEANATLRELVDDAGYPVAVAIVEEFLGTRIDHVVELTTNALAILIDIVGPLPTYSRVTFSADGFDFTEGTNRLDGLSAQVFTTANPVDDAGQTRTRNQRAVLRAILNTLDVRKLATDGTHLVKVLDPVVDGIRNDPGLTSGALARLANELRSITRKDIVAVTVPSASERLDDGSVRITFESDVLTALRESMASDAPSEFLAQLAEMGY